jgi:hypothetical protein
MENFLLVLLSIAPIALFFVVAFSQLPRTNRRRKQDGSSLGSDSGGSNGWSDSGHSSGGHGGGFDGGGGHSGGGGAGGDFGGGGGHH